MITRRTLRRANQASGWVALVGLILVLVLGQTKPPEAPTSRELSVTRLALVDEIGRTRAVLGIADDACFLTMQDELGIKKALVGVSKKGALFGISDGQTKASLEFTCYDEPRLLMSPSENDDKILLKSDRDGASLCFVDSKRVPYVLLQSEKGTLADSQLLLRDRAGSLRLMINANAAEPYIRLLDADGNNLWRAPAPPSFRSP